MSQRRTQAERNAASSQAMLDAAIEVMVFKGSRVSMKDIAEKSGFSHGLVMARFGSKAGLVKAVVHEVQVGYTQDVRDRTENKTGLQRLIALVDAFFLRISKKSHLGQVFYILWGESIRHDSEIKDDFSRIDQTFRGFIIEAINEAISQKEIRKDVKAREMASLIMAMLRGSALQLYVNPKAFNIKTAHQQALILLSALKK